ncbi:MAG: hypothetical protein ACOY90_09175 [Candidatus Zhuqueibacterota bacterium]
MNWKIKACLQKLLSKSRIGDRVNHLNALMSKDYDFNFVDYHFKEVFRKIDLMNQHNGSTKKDKIALELGTGYFLIEPIILSLLGFKKIVTVDITPDLKFKAVKRQIKYLGNDKYLNKIKKNSVLNDIEQKRIFYNLEKAESLEKIFNICNIKYIAPYKLDDIEILNLNFDLIFSQVVLEHVPIDKLLDLFKYSKKWLKKTGLIIHVINFTIILQFQVCGVINLFQNLIF